MRALSPSGRVLFNGEIMRCIVCGAEQQSDPNGRSEWRSLEFSGRVFYACPKEFPPDGATAKQFQAAHERVIRAAIAAAQKAAIQS